MYLFNKEINNIYDWGAIFQSLEAFKELIAYIYQKEKIKTNLEISNLTPGSNAVFKVDNTVIKIFAPLESTLNSENSMDIELQGNVQAKDTDICSPNIIASGEVLDKYLFKYIIFEYAKGVEIGNIFKNSSKEDKQHMVQGFKNFLTKFNTIEKSEYNSNFLVTSFANEQRWSGLNDIMYKEGIDYLTNFKYDKLVRVHGDLTGENILVNNNEICVIDFADSRVSIPEYEYAPIIFSSMKYNIEGIKLFFNNLTNEQIAEKLFIGLIIHEYGLSYIEEFLETKQLKLENLESIHELREIICNDLLTNN